MTENTNGQARSLEDVQTILSHAKLKSSDFLPTVQCIDFSTHMDNSDIKLLELDQHLLQHLNTGDILTIRGDKTDSAVLCTNDRTFEIKDAETSNSLLLLSECSYAGDIPASDQQNIIVREVCSVQHAYLELRPCKPRLKRMRQCLEKNQYSGQECEGDADHQGKKYTYSELLDIVQGSEAELQKALLDMQCCIIDGYWRMLDFDFLSKVICSIASLVDENNWDIDAVPLQDCYHELEELYPRNIIKHIIDCYATKTDQAANKTETDGEIYKLNEDKICRFFAEMLLKATGKFNFKEFLDAWQQSVPHGMTTGLYQLEGVALIDRSSKLEVIWHFPISDLPEDIVERFNFLFKTKEKWTLEEITPYIKDIATEKVGVGSLLMKHARASTQNGIRVYNSKKPVS